MSSTKPSKKLGAGRLLIAVYAIFAISATARALYQLIRKFDEAPLAYSLSLFSAAVYLVATIALAKQGARNLAAVTLAIELLGVLVVGTLSYTNAAYFAHPSVWSYFGQGYGYVPLFLPIVGLIWLRGKPND